MATAATTVVPQTSCHTHTTRRQQRTMDTADQDVEKIVSDLDAVGKDVERIAKDLGTIDKGTIGKDVETIDKDMNTIDKENSIGEAVATIDKDVDSIGKDMDKINIDVEKIDKGVDTIINDADTIIKDVDRGYAWVVLAAVFMTFILTSVTNTTSTLLYQAYLSTFELPASSVGLMMSVMLSARLLSSPVIGLLNQKFSFRTVAMAGTMIYSLGILLLGHSNGLPMLYGGCFFELFGEHVVLMSSFNILPFYFSKKRGLAMAVSTCGFNFGTMIFPPLVTRSFNYFGYTQTFIFMACVSLQLLVTTSLYRPKAPSPNALVTAPHTSQSNWVTFKEKSGVSVLKRPLLIQLMFCTASLSCMFNLLMIYTSGLAMERASMSSYDIANALVIAGFCEFAKLGIGALFDLPIVRPYRMYLYCLWSLLSGFLGLALTFTSDTISFTVIFTIYLTLISAVYAQNITILGDATPLKDLPQVMNFNRALSGILLLVIPPLVGRIKDLWDSFQIGFISASVFHVTVVLSYTLAYFCKSQRTSKIMAQEHKPETKGDTHREDMTRL